MSRDLPAILMLALLPGCPSPSAHVSELNTQITSLERDKRELERRVLALDQHVEDLEQSLGRLSTLGDERLSVMPVVDHIEIDRLSGGRDFDGALGDDGLVVYVNLFDEDGQRFKAAGDLELVVFDVDASGPTDAAVIAQRTATAIEAKKLWYGRLLTYHYKLELRWGDRQPSGRHVLARIRFLDYLTGRMHQATRQIEVAPPPGPPGLLPIPDPAVKSL